ncbi:MAG: oxygenase MpaB family protein [Chloroflexota bacterium]
MSPPRARSRDPGLFGPGSAAWRIDAQSLVLAGGTCALLMQLAHPAVAAGVAQHSDFRADPFARLRRTLTASYAVVFGTTPRAERAIRRMNAIHRSVRGAVPESGAAYQALDPQLLLWVHATLIDTALCVTHTFIRRLSADEAQAYHEESKMIAVALGVPGELMPGTLDALRAWMEEQIASGAVAVSPTALDLRDSVLYPTAVPPRWGWDLAHLVSMRVMPPSLRQQYGLAWSPARERGVDRLAAVTRLAWPRLPGWLRTVPQARRAERRLNG